MDHAPQTRESSFALRRHLSGIEVPHLSLGEYPTPITPLATLDNVWLKREDLSSPLYGGNKVRTLETLLADARARGIQRVVTLGAYGSNQALAHIVHAKRHGFEPGAVLFPQRATPTASANLRVMLAECSDIRTLRSIATFPLNWWKQRRAHGRGSYLIPPGGAVPLGALGHVSAALEVADQVQAKDMPAPKHIVLAIGSTCTTAGLLVGFPLAKHLGRWVGDLPTIHAIRVTPWPVTARSQVMGLTRRTAKYLHEVGGPRIELSPKMLRLSTKQFGWGYARPTRAGLAAIRQFEEWEAPPLDTTYAAKSGAALLAGMLDEPTLFWCTKSSAPLPDVDPQKLADVPAYIKQWLNRADNWNASA